MTLIYFILILGITVFIHELGHFLCAKKFGVYVYEFSIGMGPRLFKFKRKNDETDYCIRLFPIGGFVQMAGEEIEENSNIPKNLQLQSKKAYQRLIIMLAGVFMNFLLAIVLLFFLGLFNSVSFNNVNVTNSVVEGLNDGDKIVAINDHFVNNYDKLALEMTIASKNPFNMTVKDKNGNKKNVEITPVNVGSSGLIYGKDYGFSVSDLTVTSSNNTNIKEGFIIKKINGVDVTSYTGALELLNKVSDENLTITFLDKENLIDVSITPTTKKDKSSGYSYGFYITGTQEKGFFAAIKYAFYKFFSTLEQMIFTIFYLITGKISLSMLSGPVGIFNAVGVYAKYGFSNLVSLLCLICINVGFINVLPLPAFDGGHVLFIIIEKIRGKKVDPKVENTIHSIGFILLILLMIYVTFNDVIKLF